MSSVWYCGECDSRIQDSESFCKKCNPDRAISEVLNSGLLILDQAFALMEFHPDASDVFKNNIRILRQNIKHHIDTFS